MPPENPAILLAAYGSPEPRALATYEAIRQRYQQAFPGSEVRLAFTSDLMRRRLEELDGVSIPGPIAALAGLHEAGVRDAVVQSSQIVPGEEFHRLASLVRELSVPGRNPAFHSLALGLPLLCSLDDCRAVSARLAPLFGRGAASDEVPQTPADARKTATVLVGHGTGHPADSLYAQMAQVLSKGHHDVFLGTLEGSPGIDDLIPELRRSGAEGVRLMPFLLVTGGHATRDMAGDGRESWKSIFEREGFEVVVDLKALGENEEIVAIFIEHTKKALETLE